MIEILSVLSLEMFMYNLEYYIVSHEIGLPNQTYRNGSGVVGDCKIVIIQSGGS